MKYDDNETEFLLLSAEHVRWDRRPLGQGASKLARGPTPPPSEAGLANGTPPPGAASTAMAGQGEAAAMQTGEAKATHPAEGSNAGGAALPGTDTPIEDKAAEAARLEVEFPDHIPFSFYTFILTELKCLPFDIF